MPGHIDLYTDTVSLYSWFAITYLLSQRDLLQSHNVTLTLHPFFLGAVQVTTGNVPPFKIPAKAKYMAFDGPRAASHFGLEYKRAPAFFPMASLAAQRCLIVIQDSFGADVFEGVTLGMFQAVWQDGRDLGDNTILRDVLDELLSKFGIGKNGEVDMVLQEIQNKATKDKLSQNTAEALELGAFGAPFMNVKRWKDGEDGKEVKGASFFGSDRFEFIFDYLGLPLQRMRILRKDELTEKAKL